MPGSLISAEDQDLDWLLRHGNYCDTADDSLDGLWHYCPVSARPNSRRPHYCDSVQWEATSRLDTHKLSKSISGRVGLRPYG